MIAIIPAGHGLPDGVISIPITDFTLPLLVLWPAGRPSALIYCLQEAMNKEDQHTSASR